MTMYDCRSNKKNQRLVLSSSVLIAAMLNIQYLNLLITELIYKAENVLVVLFLLIAVMCLCVLISLRIKLKVTFFFLPIFLIVVFCLNVLLGYIDFYDALKMLIFLLIPYIIMLLPLNVELILRSILFLSIFAFPFLNIIFRNVSIGNTAISASMGNSYMMLPFALSAILHFWYYRSKKILYYLIYAINIIITWKLVLYSSRGVLLAIGTLIILIFYFSSQKNKKLAILLIITSISVFTLMIINLESILMNFEIVLNSIGIKSSFIDKNLHLIGYGDISNGRMRLYKLAITGIKNSFLIGNGIETFGINNGLLTSYPHNLILQILYEGGIVLLSPFIYIFYTGIKSLLKVNINQDTSILFMLLFSVSIPRLMVSQDFWLTVSFWMLIGFLLILKNRIN